MSRKRGSRPRRGRPGPNVLVEGDPGSVTGVSRDPQHGAAPDVSLSGDLDAREFGTPQADIPGGVKHLVNPETKPAKTPEIPRRPADYHKEHGVEPDDWGQYVLPPDESEHVRADRPAPEVKWDDPVPVRIVEGKHPRVHRAANANRINIQPNTSVDPTRVCNRDQERVILQLLCDDASNDVRISEERATLLEGGGALLSHSATSYTNVPAQNELWALSAGSAASHLSVIMVTETPL